MLAGSIRVNVRLIVSVAVVTDRQTGNEFLSESLRLSQRIHTEYVRNMHAYAHEYIHQYSYLHMNVYIPTHTYEYVNLYAYTYTFAQPHTYVCK
jgi:hypothetical protein